MNYQEALIYLSGLSKFGMNLGLKRIKTLLNYVENPEENLAVVHIGGTNGKGSTTALLASILKEAGYRVGSFTSPHLYSYNERISLNGQPISAEDFTKLIEEVIPYVLKVKEEYGENPTEFEVLTMIAFLYFSRVKAQIAVIEVGLGGDLDSTNVIEKPLLAIITNVSVDHAEQLGSTPSLIAQSKAGIIKKDCPVITASNDVSVLKVLRKKSAELQAPFYEVSREVQGDFIGEIQKGQLFTAKTSLKDYGTISLPLLGKHQIINSYTALLAAELLQKKGWEITEESILKGLKGVKWPGRLEILKEHPTIIIDGAHNPAGIKALTQWLIEHKNKYGKVILLIGMLADKDREQAAFMLAPHVNKVIVTKPLSPRAEKWQELGEYFPDFCQVIYQENWLKALHKACEIANAEDLILVTGSLYLIGEILRSLKE